MPRWIVVDDHCDTDIAYTGNWLGVRGLFNSSKADVSVENAISKSGTKLTSSGSLSFPFSGTDIAVFGVSSALSNSTAGSKFIIECFVDGESIGGSNAFGAFPWTSYCSRGGLGDGSHTLTANITADEANPFWLDFIRYAPSPSASIDNKVMMIDSTDPAVEYASTAGWTEHGMANVTTTATAGSVAKVTFRGTFMRWYSLSGDAASRVVGQTVNLPNYIEATLDGKTIGIGLPALQGPDFSYNKILFDVEATPGGSSGDHVLEVKYTPTAGSPEALSLDFVLINTGVGNYPGGSDSSASAFTFSQTILTQGAASTAASTVGASPPATTSLSADSSVAPTSSGIRPDVPASGIAFILLIATLFRLMRL